MKMNITLTQILNLVGKLDDSPGKETPRERFRRYLKENVKEPGQVRDYIHECLTNTGNQYNRALQDLVNHLGSLLGFEVTYGRYQGLQGEIGYDGHWRSPTGFHLVIEVKTTDVYAIKITTLIRYVDELISEKKIPDWDKALGVYVIGRPDPQINQLEDSILAQKRTHQLRIISVESLLTLAEMMNEYDVSHEDILALIRPSGPKIDPVVDLIARLVGERGRTTPEPPKEGVGEVPQAEKPDVNYWLTPVKSDEKQTAEEIIQTLVGREKIYAFGEKTHGRKSIKPGDWICFYASTKGVVAHAQIQSAPEKKPNPKLHHPERYPWTFRLDKVQLYLEKPVVINSDVRSQLDAFQGQDSNKSWGWFVQGTHSISKHDFNILTRQEPSE